MVAFIQMISNRILMIKKPLTVARLEKLMISGEIEILSKLIIVERINIYLATKTILRVYKKIHNKSFSPS